MWLGICENLSRVCKDELQRDALFKQPQEQLIAATWQAKEEIAVGEVGSRFYRDRTF